MTEQGTIEGEWVDVAEVNNMELRIDPELRSIIRPLTDEERSNLERSLLEEGVRDPIVLWGSVIVDGHNRYEIASGNNEDGQILSFDTAQIEFASRAEAKLWIAKNQLSRRNLTDADRFELAEHIYGVEKELAEERMIVGKRVEGGEDPPPNLGEVSEDKHEKESATRAAKAVGLGRENFRKLRKVRGSGRTELWEAIRDGELSVDRAYQIVRITEELPGELGEEVASLDPDIFTFVHDPKQLDRLKRAGEEEGMVLLELIVSDDKEDIRTVFAAEKYLKNKYKAGEPDPTPAHEAEKRFFAIQQRLHELAAGIDMAGGLHKIVKHWPEQNQRIFISEYRALAERVIRQVEEFEQLKGGDLNELQS